MFLQRRFDRAPIGAALLGQQERLPVEVAGSERLAPGEPVPARNEQGHLLGEERLEVEAQLGRRRGAEAEVELSVGDAAADAVGSRHVEPHPQRRSLALEPSEERHDRAGSRPARSSRRGSGRCARP